MTRRGRQPLVVYLSSTLNDLASERDAIGDVLRDVCVVAHSYGASEHAVRESCLEDVSNCDVYLGILGLRYGFVPADPHDPRSITEREYDRAGAAGKPRLIFLKREDSILAINSDGHVSGDGARIHAFRNRVCSDVRPAHFATCDELRVLVLKALQAFEGNGDPPLADDRRNALHDSLVRRNYLQWLRRECDRGTTDSRRCVAEAPTPLRDTYVPAVTLDYVEGDGPRMSEPGRHHYSCLLNRLG